MLANLPSSVSSSTFSLILNFVPNMPEIPCLKLTTDKASRLVHLDKDHKNQFLTQGSTTKNVISRGYVYLILYAIAS